MRCKTLVEFLISKNIFSESHEFPLLIKYSGLDHDIQYIDFDSFIRLFARLIIYSVISNAIELISKIKEQSMFLSIPLKLMSYQRQLYLYGMKHYDELNEEEESIINSIQELEIISKTKSSQTNLNKVHEFNKELKREKIESSSESESDIESIKELMKKPRKELTIELMAAIKMNGNDLFSSKNKLGMFSTHTQHLLNKRFVVESKLTMNIFKTKNN